jgi:hypothetical protein
MQWAHGRGDPGPEALSPTLALNAARRIRQAASDLRQGAENAGIGQGHLLWPYVAAQCEALLAQAEVTATHIDALAEIKDQLTASQHRAESAAADAVLMKLEGLDELAVGQWRAALASVARDWLVRQRFLVAAIPALACAAGIGIGYLLWADRPLTACRQGQVVRDAAGQRYCVAAVWLDQAAQPKGAAK